MSYNAFGAVSTSVVAHDFISYDHNTAVGLLTSSLDQLAASASVAPGGECAGAVYTAADGFASKRDGRKCAEMLVFSVSSSWRRLVQKYLSAYVLKLGRSYADALIVKLVPLVAARLVPDAGTAHGAEARFKAKQHVNNELLRDLNAIAKYIRGKGATRPKKAAGKSKASAMQSAKGGGGGTVQPAASTALVQSSASLPSAPVVSSAIVADESASPAKIAEEAAAIEQAAAAASSTLPRWFWPAVPSAPVVSSAIVADESASPAKIAEEAAAIEQAAAAASSTLPRWFWPAVLVVGGGFVLLRRRRSREAA